MQPFMLTTWSFGPTGNDAAFPSLLAGGEPLDAVVHAATVIEADPTIDSVGVGGLPDVDGEVSLDACVMTDPQRCGAVVYLRRFPNPTQIARRVMEKTIHVTLAGDGAEAFARREGFRERDLLTDEAKETWRRWRDDPTNIDRDKYRGWIPPLNVEEMRGVSPQPPAGRRPEPSHDTVGILVRDASGRLAGACSTSGMAFKVPGRVGDSPMIGQGLYVDQEAGACCATGTGELITGVCASFLVVEEMRRGAAPEAAVREALERIRRRDDLHPEHQVGLLAIDRDGNWTSGALRPGFHHTITDADGSRVQDPHFVLLDS